MTPIAAFWSGGKDSALALDRLRREGAYEVVSLITTVNPDYQRVSMHGVREGLVEAQADALGVPLQKMYVGSSGTNDEYVAALRRTLSACKARGIAQVAYGDIFLEDLRQWRESFLAEAGMTGVFPLWRADTTNLVQEFIARGFKALTCCTNDAYLTREDVGRPLDQAFFAGLPAGVDPCGENGEYHSFVYDGPIFTRPVPFVAGEIVYRPLEAASAPDDGDPAQPRIAVPATTTPGQTRGFWFADLLPAADSQ